MMTNTATKAKIIRHLQVRIVADILAGSPLEQVQQFLEHEADPVLRPVAAGGPISKRDLAKLVEFAAGAAAMRAGIVLSGAASTDAMRAGAKADGL